MVSCSCCTFQLDANDKHEKCFLHRDCSRSKPCPLDINNSDVYWDQIEHRRAVTFGKGKKVSKAGLTKGRTSTRGRGGKSVSVKGLGSTKIQIMESSQAQEGSGPDVISDKVISSKSVVKEQVSQNQITVMAQIHEHSN